MRNIWYASYGSNILEQRFLCYIQGGIPKGIDKEYFGCKDKSLPKDSEEFYISSEIYFAKKSRTWNNKGVAFLSNNFGQKETKAKMYLITEEQFIDIVKQENDFDGEVIIDFNLLKKNGSTTIEGINWYNKLIFLGDKDNCPILTFTHENDYFLNSINGPDKTYLKIIMEGLVENFNCNEYDLLEYFENIKGIKNYYTKDELIELAKSL